MAKRDGRTKATRAEFYKAMRALIAEIGVITKEDLTTIPNEPSADFRIDTIFGGAVGTVYSYWVYLHFDDANCAIGMRPSGKWNHYWFGDPETVEQVITRITTDISKVALTGPEAQERIAAAIEKDKVVAAKWGKIFEQRITSQQAA
jgi:hypothetical protein